MAFNIVNHNGDINVPLNSHVGWLTLPAPGVGRIVRLAISQIAGTNENVDCKIDIYSAAAAKVADLASTPLLMPQYQVLPQQVLVGNGSAVFFFGSQGYCNADKDNLSRGQGLYVRVDKGSNVNKTYRVSITIETEQ